MKLSIVQTPQIAEDHPARNNSRIIIKRGSEHHVLRSEHIVYLFVHQKLVFAVDKDNLKHLCESSNLAEISETLDPRVFIRVNRKYIINAAFIIWFKSIGHGRLKLGLAQMPPEDIIVSQGAAPRFRKWIRMI